MTEIGPNESVLLGALTDGVILTQDGRVDYANPAAARLLGVAPTELHTGLVPAALVDLVQRAAVEGPTEDVFERGNPSRWIQVSARLLNDADAGVMVVLRDVTDRRKVEAMRRDFVADASHELKTPVASIQAAAETLLLAMDNDLAAARRFAHQVHATAGRLSGLVNDLFDLSRVESERPEYREVNLAVVIAKEVNRLTDRAEVRGIDLVVGGDDILIWASRKDLRLAVRNLLENALAYTPEGGAVTVSTGQDGATAVIVVSDTGVGIPVRDLPRVFERFYRVDDARNRDTGGTGLGLAIVRHVADQHGGSVSVDSELGHGSTFSIRLPLASAEAK